MAIFVSNRSPDEVDFESAGGGKEGGGGGREGGGGGGSLKASLMRTQRVKPEIGFYEVD